MIANLLHEQSFAEKRLSSKVLGGELKKLLVLRNVVASIMN